MPDSAFQKSVSAPYPSTCTTSVFTITELFVVFGILGHAAVGMGTELQVGEG